MQPASSGAPSGAQPETVLRAISARKYDGLHFVSHMIAGAMAGTIEHTAMYPVDTIKTRMQALSHPGQRLHRVSVLESLKTAIRREGIAGLYKGVGAVALGAGPAHALHFAVYELSKETLGGNRGSGHHPLIAGASGILATVVNEAIMTPADVVKQRLQVAHSPYRNITDCMLRMAREEGLLAFYRSYRTTLVMNIPYQTIHFAIYEAAKKVLLEPIWWHRSERAGGGSLASSAAAAARSSSGGGGGGGVPSAAAPERPGEGASGSEAAGRGGGDDEGDEGDDEGDALEDSLSTQLVAGGLAGGVASALTTPFDVVKTRLQTEGVHSAMRYGGSAVLPTMRRIVREEGAYALWRGLKPRVMFHVPAAAVCWGTYESMKAMLLAREV